MLFQGLFATNRRRLKRLMQRNGWPFDGYLTVIIFVCSGVAMYGLVLLAYQLVSMLGHAAFVCISAVAS